MQEYTLKFTKLSIYAPSLVSNPRVEVSHFVTGVSKHLSEECRLAMLHDKMDIFRFMGHAQHVKKTRLERKNREFKRAKSFE